MEISEQGIALIKKYEGFSKTPYFCPAGKRTIGYGHVIGAGEFFPAEGISEQEAEIILTQDIQWAEQGICRCVQIELSQNQFDALVSLCYNIGIQAFEKSTLLALLNAKNLPAAASEFGRWVYAKGVKLPGLVQRRQAESRLFSGLATFT